MSPRSDGPDALGDVTDGAVLQQITECADVQGFIKHTLVVIHRQEDNSDLQTLLPDLSGYLKTFHVRHVDVQHRDVRLQLLNNSESCHPIGRLAHDMDAMLHFDHLSQALTEDRMIVSNHDAYLRLHDHYPG